jgi:hypothetical protein
MMGIFLRTRGIGVRLGEAVLLVKDEADPPASRKDDNF